MSDSTRKKSKISGGCSECIPAHLDRQRAFEQAKRFVLAVVDV